MCEDTTLISSRLNILSIHAIILVLDKLVEALCLSPLLGLTSTRTRYIYCHTLMCHSPLERC